MKRTDLLWVLMLGLVVRSGLLWGWDLPLAGDALDYDRLARGILDGSGYVNSAGQPTAWRPPLYPAFLAAVYSLFGAGGFGIRACQVVLDLILITMVGRFVAGRFGRVEGLAASFFVAINVSTASATGRVLSETLASALVFSATVLFAHSLRPPGESEGDARGAEPDRVSLFALGAGLLFALATLSRGVFLLLVPTLLALAAVSRLHLGRRSWQLPPRSALLLVLGFAIGLAPWTARNVLRMGAPIPVSTQLGHTLYASVHPPDGWRFGLLATDSLTAAASSLPETEANTLLTRRAMSDFFSEPRSIPGRLVLKAAFFLVPLDWEVLPWYGAFNPTYTLILLFAVMAFLVPRSRSGHRPPSEVGPAQTWYLWGPLLYGFMMALVFYGSPRFRLPFEPFLCVLAGLGFARLVSRKGARSSVFVGACLLVGLTAFGWIYSATELKSLLRALVSGAAGGG